MESPWSRCPTGEKIQTTDAGLLVYEKKRNIENNQGNMGLHLTISRWGSEKSDGSSHRASAVEQDPFTWKERSFGSWAKFSLIPAPSLTGTTHPSASLVIGILTSPPLRLCKLNEIIHVNGLADSVNLFNFLPYFLRKTGSRIISCGREAGKRVARGK